MKRYIEVQTIGENDCKECCFAKNCTNHCRIEKGYHWEETKLSKFFKVVNFINTNDIGNAYWQTWWNMNKLDESLEEKPGIAMWPGDETMDFIIENKPDTTIHLTTDIIAIYYL